MKIRNEQDEVTTLFAEELRQLEIIIVRIMSIFGFLFLALAFSDSFWKGYYVAFLLGFGLFYFVTNKQRFFRAISQGIEGSYFHHRQISYFFQRAFERGERHFRGKGALNEIGLFLVSLVGIGILGISLVVPIHLIWGIFSRFFIKDLTDFFLLGMPAFVLFVWWATVCGVRLVRLLIELVGYSWRLVVRPTLKFFLWLESRV